MGNSGRFPGSDFVSATLNCRGMLELAAMKITGCEVEYRQTFDEDQVADMILFLEREKRYAYFDPSKVFPLKQPVELDDLTMLMMGQLATRGIVDYEDV